MTLSTSTGEAIQKLLENDAALCETLRNTTSRQEFTSALAAAAMAKGIEVDEQVLDQGLDLGFKQYFGSNVELSETDLEGVTGGIAITTAIAIGAAVAGIVFGVSFVGGWIARDYLSKK